ncbi:MAG: helicase [Isosphaeraceae bacterium]|nr:helicase [Isosphaeraceae bacterium]
MKPDEVRSQLVEALRLDLIGPENGSELEAEVLPQAPSRWYLTGFLVPLEASEAQKSDETAQDDFDTEAGDGEATDDDVTPEPPAARRAFFPSSIGLSLLVSKATRRLTVEASWGDYRRAELLEGPHGGEEVTSEASGRIPLCWKRQPRRVVMTLDLPHETARAVEHEVPGSDGLRIAVSVRPVQTLGIAEGLVPDGTRSVSIFLVNHRTPAQTSDIWDERSIFQAGLCVHSEEPLIPRPNLKGHVTEEWDERVADLQYRDVYEYAVGHGIATHAEIGADGACRTVRTSWIPSAEVEWVAPAEIPNVELGMEALAELADGAAASQALGPFVTQYRDWIADQKKVLPSLTPKRREMAEALFHRAGTAANRIEEGIKALSDKDTLAAFRMANKVMARAARRRFGPMQGQEETAVDAPTWRPFQLAFVLMNLPGIVDPKHPDREVVDLLFFPTGGGKTEAYLGLAAFTLVYRRLKNPGYTSPGLSVLMRYTLRLLTLDQLSRAATLICALELERLKDPDTLGPWPFEIGLWVGRAATPNRMGYKGDNDPNSARSKTIAFQNDDRKPAPIPLENCPWCGEKFKSHSFQLLPNTNEPTDLRVVCLNRRCDFTRNQALPLLAVDEPIYRRLPCFLIATVDKFAAMPWTGQVRAFFGRVDRYDQHGFYGPCEPDRGRPLPAPLLPPDLIIQDELHLISGPMGTMVGLYESALDELCSRTIGGKKVRPKIIASTATVRRAEDQIRALFNHREVDIFPPPGPDRRDSFFAKTHPAGKSHPRLYLGLAAQGRSLKVVMLRTYLALLGAAQKAYEADGGKKNPDNAADPYMTLLGYFNSLRELGGSRRIIEDEVNTRLTGYANRKRVGQKEGLFANRIIAYEVVELTSRVPTNQVAEAKRQLALRFHEKDRVDVAIATNMISVGLDITRLGLMVVLGQPKTCAEYIQATSRVGRDPERPGLVVTLLNIHRPRDRSHFERFEVFHQSFYRTVEATSVTPFSPRALDRGLAGTLVALSRLGHAPMTPPKGAMEILHERNALDFVVQTLSDRASSHAALEAAEAEALRQGVRDRAKDLFDTWSQIAHDYQDKGTALQYSPTEIGAAKPLLYEFLDPDLKGMHPRHKKFRANRSMRDVEPSVNLWLRPMNNNEIEQEE